MLDIRRQFFYRKYDPLTNTIIAYQNRVQNDGGTYINECLRQRLNTELPLSDRLSILTPNGYKVSKLYSFKGTDYDFLRASNAYKFSQSGNLEVVANNEPRINLFANECPQIIIEPQFTNFWRSNNTNINGAFTQDFNVNTSFRTVGSVVNDYFATGVNAININDTSSSNVFFSGLKLRSFNTIGRNRVFSCLISEPLSPFVAINFNPGLNSNSRCVLNLNTNEVISSLPEVTAFSRKVKDNVWFVSVCRIDNAGISNEDINFGFISEFRIGVSIPSLLGNWKIGAMTITWEDRSLSNDFFAGFLPIMTAGAFTTKLADVATVTPEVGTNEIIVNNNPPITTIPATFTIPNGFIDKIVMK